MIRRIRDLQLEHSESIPHGREGEFALLTSMLDEGRPAVVHLHGIPGVGKSTLLQAFAARARSRGVSITVLEGRTVEPTERGFLHALSGLYGTRCPDVETAGDLVTRQGTPAVLAVDDYHLLGLIDQWLRQNFAPQLREHVHLVLAGRQPTSPGWRLAPEWQTLFRSIRIEPLGDDHAMTLLTEFGLPEHIARRINGFARGHPLALTLAADAVRAGADPDLHGTSLQGVLDELARTYLAEVNEPATRRALEACSLVRRCTIPLLSSLFPGENAEPLYTRLGHLPVVEHWPDGLSLHDAIRTPIAMALESADPDYARAVRRTAWRQLRSEIRTAGKGELWRFTADIIFLVNNPVVREAFFPSDFLRYTVEPATPEDGPQIIDLVADSDGPESAAALARWWTSLAAPAFRRVRDEGGAFAGFYCMFEPRDAASLALMSDSVTRQWIRHLDADPVRRGERTLFLRRWLGRGTGESPSAVQAACWLDIKRTYLALRPELRRVYLALHDPAPYALAARSLGFGFIKDEPPVLDGVAMHSAMLDFGPGSVDGWIAGLAANELGAGNDGLLDTTARQLVVDDRRITLSPREFEVMRFLCMNQGKVVPRDVLLDEVWGPAYEGGSNVVDSVIAGLRRKLSGQCDMLETVRGRGYLLRD